MEISGSIIKKVNCQNKGFFKYKLNVPVVTYAPENSNSIESDQVNLRTTGAHPFKLLGFHKSGVDANTKIDLSTLNGAAFMHTILPITYHWNIFVAFTTSIVKKTKNNYLFMTNIHTP